jgi:signal transduction histidine kinase
MLGVMEAHGFFVEPGRAAGGRLAVGAPAEPPVDGLRLARELHDVVASGFSAISVQAALAETLLDEAPSQALEALAEIRRTSREALAELRPLLAALRATRKPVSTAASERPVTALIDALITTTKKAGIDTKLTIRGRRRPLPREVELAAYRIVQEALTNILRHSGATTAAVQLNYRPNQLQIDVRDNGTATPRQPLTPGHGLTGMQERATTLGGDLRAHPCRPHGYHIHATLPVGAGVDRVSARRRRTA